MAQLENGGQPIFHLHAPEVDVTMEGEDVGVYSTRIMEIYARAVAVFPGVILDSGGNFVLSHGDSISHGDRRRDLEMSHQLADFNTEMWLTLEAAHTAVLKKATLEGRGKLNEEFTSKDRANTVQFLKDNLPNFPIKLFQGYQERLQREVEIEAEIEGSGAKEEND